MAESSEKTEGNTEEAVEQPEVKVTEDEIFVPKRVREALEKAKDFEEYRQLRVFKFLHMYSGPNDVLSKEVELEAEKLRLKVQCLSLDKKKDPSLDIGAPDVHGMLTAEVKDGEWDATHAGFPCGSFSRARHRQMEGMPGPVRDGESIYGLATNDEKQQEEADRGTMMAAQAGWLMEEQVQTCKRRGIPPAATLENPPGDQKCGSAWQLPELRQVMSNVNASVAQFNTCSFQTKLKTRWFKPGQFVGRLEGLDQLARVYRCPAWVKHEALVGKRMTEAAGEYPTELANMVAKNIVATWKRILSLEFWRHKMKVKEEEVSTLQKKWVENEEKRNQRLSQKRTIHMAVERGEAMVDELPSSSTHPSKKQRRAEEDVMVLGGMRNPAITVSRMHMVRHVGQKMRAEWINFVKEHPDAVDVATNYGSDVAKFNLELVEKWRRNLGSLFKVEDVKSEGLILKDNLAFRSPLQADLWDAWGKVARDPDTSLPNFMRKGAPLGMNVEIPSSNGIFPPAEVKENDVIEPMVEFESIKGLLNYKSVQEQPVEAKIEIDQNMRRGFVVRLSWKEAEERFKAGTCSRMALLLKQKQDGSTKRRIILDMRRSGGNSRARVEERIILPRLGDVVSMVKDLKSKEPQLYQQIVASATLLWQRRSFVIASHPMRLQRVVSYGWPCYLATKRHRSSWRGWVLRWEDFWQVSWCHTRDSYKYTWMISSFATPQCHPIWSVVFHGGHGSAGEFSQRRERVKGDVDWCWDWIALLCHHALLAAKAQAGVVGNPETLVDKRYDTFEGPSFGDWKTQLGGGGGSPYPLGGQRVLRCGQ